MPTPTLTSIPALITALALQLGLNPDDLMDAYACGEAIAIVHDGAIAAFTYAHSLSGGVRRDSHDPLRHTRVVDVVWHDPELANADDLRKRAIRELMLRLSDNTVILTEEIASLLVEPPQMVPLRSICKPVRECVISILGMSDANRRKTLKMRVACIGDEVATRAPHFCGLQAPTAQLSEHLHD